MVGAVDVIPADRVVRGVPSSLRVVLIADEIGVVRLVRFVSGMMLLVLTPANVVTTV